MKIVVVDRKNRNIQVSLKAKDIDDEKEALKEHYEIWNCWLKELIVARNISYGGVFPEWLTC